jgi:GNAT superfamily N-acetyltransferase
LSGVCGPYRLALEAVDDEATGLAGPILNGERPIGGAYWSFYRDDQGSLVAHHGLIDIQEQRFRGRGFSRALRSQLLPYYERSGVARIELTAAWQGAFAWASWNFSWDPDPHRLVESLDSIRASARRLSTSVNDDARAVLEQIVLRLEPEHPRLPEPIELARLIAPGHPELGRELLEHTRWHGVQDLQAPVADEPTHRDGRDEYRATDKLIRQADTRFADPAGDVLDGIAPDGRALDQAHQMAADLSGRYGPFAVDFNGVSVVVSPDTPPRLYLEGVVVAEDGRIAGTVGRTIYRDGDGDLVVYNTELYLESWAQRRGFATALYGELERYYRRSGVDRIEVESAFRGSYVWAKLGFEWNPRYMDSSLGFVHDRAVELADDPSTSASSRRLLEHVIALVGPDYPDPPTPRELANLATDDTPDLGRRLMTGLQWSGVVWLREEG